MEAPRSVDAVIVTYKPDLHLLDEVIRSLAPQVRTCFVVNNGSETWELPSGNCVQVIQGSNRGIAHAQNVGLALSRARGGAFALLCDQDTVFPERFVDELLQQYDQCESPQRIAALTPVFFDSIKGEFRSLMITKFRTIGLDKVQHRPTVPIVHAIASGSLISAAALERIGPMNEALFIDYVDTEWCWRAREAGYQVLSCPHVRIQHRLGDRVLRVGGWVATLRSDIRHYYMIRNALYLLTGGTRLSPHERVLFATRIARMIVGVLLLGGTRWALWRLVCVALADGLRHRLGPYRGR